VASEPSRMTARCMAVPGFALAALAVTVIAGCGYTNKSLFPDDVGSVYIEMFDNRTFRRGIEYTLSDALAKRMESDTPYKIVSNRDRTDSVLDGQLVVIAESILTLERETGQALEKEVVLTATVNWKNLRTGRMMINNQSITAAASYSEFLNQDFTYGSSLAANKLAEKIVEVMQDNW
jgi:outer membrane lipopolysaccharide assembly protein LptE/RlpB